MVIAFFTAALGILAWLLRLPVFETVIGLLLLVPIAVYPFVGSGDISVLAYGLTLLFLGGACVWLQRGGAARSRGAFLDSTESLGVFLVFFLFNYSLCLLWPDFIAMGERLRDYALLASVYHSPVVPREPWLAGAALNYYLYWYRFGHLLGTIGGLEVWQIYPQLQSFTFALFTAAVFHLTRRTLRLRPERALVAAVIVAYGSNIAGIEAFLADDDNWWGPSRVIPGAINEFPAWSFLLGDLHPHFMNLCLAPFLVVLAVGLLARRDRLSGAALGALLLVSPWWIYNANAWEVPLWLGWCGLAGLSVAAALWRSETLTDVPGRLRALSRDLRFWVVVGGALGLTVSLFLSSRNIVPGDTPLKLVTGDIARTHLGDLLRHWGFPLALIGASLVALRAQASERGLAALLLGATLLSPEALPFLGALTALATWRAVTVILEYRQRPAESALPALIVNALGVGALALLILPEVVFLDDPYGGENERMNTIFKVYAATWFALHLFAFTLLAEVGRQLRGGTRIRGALTALGVVAAILLTGFFVRTIDLRRTKERFVQPYAQGLSEISRRFEGAGAAIQELLRLPRGVVLESQGPAYDYTTHVATLSGNPAFLGWANHVNLLTRAYGEISRREEVTREFYLGADCNAKRSVLTREGIDYVVLGPLERKAYPGLEPGSFDCLRPVITRGSYTIFAP